MFWPWAWGCSSCVCTMQLRLDLWSRDVLRLSGIQDHYRIDVLLHVLAVSMSPSPCLPHAAIVRIVEQAQFKMASRPGSLSHRRAGE